MTEVCNRKNSVSGEAQRVKLATELSRCATGKTLYASKSYENVAIAAQPKT